MEQPAISQNTPAASAKACSPKLASNASSIKKVTRTYSPNSISSNPAKSKLKKPRTQTTSQRKFRRGIRFKRALKRELFLIPNQSLICESMSFKIKTPIRNRSRIHPFHSIVSVIPPEPSIHTRDY